MKRFSDLHGIAPGLSGYRLVVEPYSDQRRHRSSRRSIDQPLKVFFGDMATIGSVAASKLGAIPAIVNMPRCSGDLRLPALPGVR